MRTFIDALREVWLRSAVARFSSVACGIIVLSAIGMNASCQSPSPAQPAPSSQAPVQSTQAPASQSVETIPAAAKQSDTSKVPARDPALSQGAFTVHTVGGEIKEDQLKQLLVGKTMYLRDGYLDNNLEFDEHGRLLGHSPKGSFTLSQIQINKVKLSKRKLELVGDRYALHFLGAAPFEDPMAATDRVKITPKKKSMRISLSREEVEKPKKKDKSENKRKKHHAKNEDTETASRNQKTTGSDIPDSPVSPALSDHISDKKGQMAAVSGPVVSAAAERAGYRFFRRNRRSHDRGNAGLLEALLQGRRRQH